MIWDAKRGLALALIVGMMLSFLPITGGVNIEVLGSPSALTPHAPIRIDGNADFTVANGVTNFATGNGTVWNPWVIENWTIDGSGVGFCLYIGNTTEHFVVRNCSLYNASGNLAPIYYEDFGIGIYNSDKGTVHNNTITNCHSAIFLKNDAELNNLTNNSVSDSAFGIYFSLDNCENNSISGNTISDCENGTYFNTSSNNNTVVNNSISNCTNTGIWLLSDYNLIYGNQIIDNPVSAKDSGFNSWDASYPSGGNYWSDYTGADMFHGPNQDIPGGDGIGDTNYTFVTGVDNYPLMGDSEYPFATDQSPNGTDVPLDTNITITWNETMNWPSVEGAFNITNGTFVWNGTNGTWAHDALNNTSNFEPGFNLTYNTTYTVTVNVTALDLDGLALDQDKNGTGGYPNDILTWNFITQMPPETISPRALTWTPPTNATDVHIDTTINVTWNETMNWDSVNASFSYTNGTTVWTGMNGTWQFNDTFNTSVFTPTEQLAFEENYTVTFNKTATDIVGNALNQSFSPDGNLTWNFTTINAVPYVIYSEPRNIFPLDDSVNPEAPFVITFSEAMNRTSVVASLSYTNGTGSFNGTNGTWDWSAGSNIATFQPDQALDNNTAYTVTLNGSMARDLDGRLLDGNNDTVGGDDYAWGFTTWARPPPPTILYLTPVRNATMINVNTDIIIAFNISGYGNTMNEASVESAFSVTADGGGSIWDDNDGTFLWSENSKIMTYSPTNFFDYETNYTIRLRGTAKSTYGMGIDSNNNGVSEGSVTDDMVTEFRTSPRPPVVVETSPADGEDSVPVDLDFINITFDKPMDNASVVSALTISPSVASIISWHDNNTKMSVDLTANITYEINYTVTLDSNIATDEDGTWLDGNGDGAFGDDYVFRFSTIEAPDTTGPNITEVIPPDGAIDISINVKLGVMFSEPMNETSVEQAFLMTNSTGSKVNGTFVWNMDSSLLQFVPHMNLTTNTTYTVSISGTARDANENPMIYTYSWSFTTSLEKENSASDMLWYMVGIIMFLLIIIMHQRTRYKHLQKQHRKARVKIKQMKNEMIAAGLIEPPKPRNEADGEDIPDVENADEETPEEDNQGMNDENKKDRPGEEDDTGLDDFSSGHE